MSDANAGSRFNPNSVNLARRLNCPANPPAINVVPSAAYTVRMVITHTAGTANDIFPNTAILADKANYNSSSARWNNMFFVGGRVWGVANQGTGGAASQLNVVVGNLLVEQLQSTNSGYPYSNAPALNIFDERTGGVTGTPCRAAWKWGSLDRSIKFTYDDIGSLIVVLGSTSTTGTYYVDLDVVFVD